jgi:hypothetical protein
MITKPALKKILKEIIQRRERKRNNHEQLGKNKPDLTNWIPKEN